MGGVNLHLNPLSAAASGSDDFLFSESSDWLRNLPLRSRLDGWNDEDPSPCSYRRLSEQNNGP